MQDFFYLSRPGCHSAESFTSLKAKLILLPQFISNISDLIILSVIVIIVISHL